MTTRINLLPHREMRRKQQQQQFFIMLGVVAAIGGAIGGTLAYLAFNGYQTSTMNFSTFSQVAFAFAVTPQLLGLGVTYALLMGLVGGLFPALRAARLPIPSALREL